MKWISPVGWCVAFGCRVDAEGGVDGPDWGGVSPHPVVAEMVAAYLELADAEAPTLVEGLYLVGSAALDDFRPGASDVDFVAVTAAPLDAVRLVALRRVHDRLRRRRRRPFLDVPTSPGPT